MAKVVIHREWGLRGSLQSQVRIAKQAKDAGLKRTDGARVRRLASNISERNKT